MASPNFEIFVPDFIKNSTVYFAIVTDLEGVYQYVNKRFQARFDFLGSDFIGKSFMVGIHPDDHLICLETVKSCLAHPGRIVPVFLRKPIKGQKEHVWSHWEFSTLLDENQVPLGVLCIGHDITDAEKATRKAQELAERVETILEEISDGFLHLGVNMEIRRINSKFERLFELDRKDILGKSAPELEDKGFNENLLQKFSTILLENQLAVFEEFLVPSQKWVLITVYPSNAGLTCFIRDITEEKRRKAHIELSENKLKAVYDSTVDSNLLIGLEGEILNFNRVANETSLKTKGKELVLGSSIEDFLPEDSLEGFRENFPRALEGNQVQIEVLRYLRGVPYWFEVSYFPVRDASGSLMGVAMNIKDINARKLTELELKESQGMLNAIYNSTSEAWFFLDKELKIKSSNKAAKLLTQSLLGRPMTIGESFLDFPHLNSNMEVASYLKQVIAGSKINFQKFQDSRWWDILMEPVFDSERSEIIGVSYIMKDISLMKENEDRILKQNELLKEITWHQSHGLRRYVANILALCDLVINYSQDSEQEREEFITMILAESKNLDSLIHKIVALSSHADLRFEK
ncbi:PAS domain-containing protein [Algoriphagus sp. AK58]|uniref:PAS domain-containing protein n=1 Tax=Algoriphagus sp. AK58 TaxID=1406877 RepID=UPI001650C0BD|nr:PAS domain-containing protein [Algoriphagus sp. AK58]MBC6365746.1 hypothetical protein [Algoriphagus sp. AK58]